MRKNAGSNNTYRLARPGRFLWLSVCIAAVGTAASSRVLAAPPGEEAAAVRSADPEASSQEKTEAPAESPPETQGPPSAESQALPGAGLRVYIDPDTGELTSQPTPEQTRALSEAMARTFGRPTRELKAFDLPNGGKGVMLDGRFDSALVVRVKEDGSHELTCVKDPGKLQKVLKSRPPKAELQ